MVELRLFAPVKLIETLLESQVDRRLRDRRAPNVVLGVVVGQNGKRIKQSRFLQQETTGLSTVKSWSFILSRRHDFLDKVSHQQEGSEDRASSWRRRFSDETGGDSWGVYTCLHKTVRSRRIQSHPSQQYRRA